MQIGAASSTQSAQTALFLQAQQAQRPPVKSEANDPPAERAAELAKARGGVDVKV